MFSMIGGSEVWGYRSKRCPGNRPKLGFQGPYDYHQNIRDGVNILTSGGCKELKIMNCSVHQFIRTTTLSPLAMSRLQAKKSPEIWGREGEVQFMAT